MKKILVAIISYKRGENQATNYLLYKLGLKEKYDNLTFIYENDPERNIYESKPKIVTPHIIPSTDIPKPNICAKRNYVLNYAYENGYDYLFTIDDDLQTINNKDAFDEFVETAMKYFEENPKLAMVGPAMNILRAVDHPMVEWDAMTHSCCILNVELLVNSNINYGNDIPAAEDAHIGLCCLEKGLRTLQLNNFAFTYTTVTSSFNDDSGNAYRFKGQNKRDAETNALISLHKDFYGNKVIYVGENGYIKLDYDKLKDWRLSNKIYV